VKRELLALATALVAAWAGTSGAQVSARTNYVLRCAGCHGMDGRSVARAVPDLQGRVGYFLCTKAGRDYVGRLPNVAFAEISDADMAALLNYIASDLSAEATPRGSAFSAEELAPLRRRPLVATDLKGYRRSVVDQLIHDCGAPRTMRTEYGPAARR
jgi:cytochrome c553